ncbi:hypothetical protein HZH68_003840 [Vespula germanica]|uniref:Uncharacterized protein n=1 Tax=Vespula germanica TaxID=30212 RepID=A0A834NIV5_VESGE|nr:hypothetical protein HZH68_003840 [Vespula germanica]
MFVRKSLQVMQLESVENGRSLYYDAQKTGFRAAVIRDCGLFARKPDRPPLEDPREDILFHEPGRYSSIEYPFERTSEENASPKISKKREAMKRHDDNFDSSHHKIRLAGADAGDGDGAGASATGELDAAGVLQSVTIKFQRSSRSSLDSLAQKKIWAVEEEDRPARGSADDYEVINSTRFHHIVGGPLHCITSITR